MKYIKYIFIFSIINLIILITTVLYLNYWTEKESVVSKQIVPNVSITVSPTSSVSTSKNKLTATPTKGNRCIVVVDGVSYDVTSFKNQHSGGDIFVCGADMSTAFHGQHSQRYLDQMARYRI